MPLQIANPIVVRKVEELAQATGLSKIAAAERAVDRLLNEARRPADAMDVAWALLGQIDRVPDRPDAFDPLEWDDRGLPQ